jgi:hypothetical protein
LNQESRKAGSDERIWRPVTHDPKLKKEVIAAPGFQIQVSFSIPAFLFS